MLKSRVLTGIFLLICSLLNPSVMLAQEETKDITDVIKKIRKDTTAATSNEIVVGKKYISILPVIGYAPANGFLIGGVLSVSKQTGEFPTKLSSGMLNAQLTTKKQFIVNARHNIYLPGNQWFLQGDWRLMIFTQPTYGLGINNSGGNKYLLALNNMGETDLPAAEPMKFNYIRIYEDVVYRLGLSSWYIGAGVAMDRHFDIKDEKLNTDTANGDIYITNHYAYSVSKDFGPTNYYTSGVKANVMVDTRDNLANAYKGVYAYASFRWNPNLSRSSQGSLMTMYDFRYYLGLSKARPRMVLAFWSYGTFVLDGNVPYLALPSIGWDTYNRSGRGYIQGRYRGLDMIYNETEFRFPLSGDGFLGGVVFLSGTMAKSTTQDLFDKIAPAAGAGIRLKMDKAARINLTVDLGYGLDHSSGIYFGMQEAF